MNNIYDSPKLRHSEDRSALNAAPKYHFEQGGMLVYDTNAQILTFPHTFSPSPPSSFLPAGPKPKNICEEDWKILTKLKSFPPCPDFKPKYSLCIPDDNITLTFNSKFESGNLYKAIKLSDYEYSLQISADMNTTGNNHWFYFSVQNPRRTPVTFNITNMKKLDLLYKSGLKPAVFSSTLFAEQKQDWHRDCSNVSYTAIPNTVYYKLSFTYTFKYEQDLVFFAYSVPYTYTEMMNDLLALELQYGSVMRVNNLCKTLVGNFCPIVTITEDVRTYENFHSEVVDWNTSKGGRRLKRIKKIKMDVEDRHKGKQAIVITARVHPGETVSSFMMKGLIKFLLEDRKVAKGLRRNFVFKLIPMLNPDGVRYGNYRCSLLGVDLNRRWDSPSKLLHPTIFAAKKMIQVLNESYPVILYCDMHGHSRKRNVFMYGCNSKTGEFEDSRKNLLAKFVPVLLACENKLFSFNDCHFRLEKDKLSTARVVMFNEFNIVHSYTIEASFFGPKHEKQFEGKFNGDMHMTQEHLASIGESLCKVFINFTSPALFWTKLQTVNTYLKARIFVPSLIKSADQTDDSSSEPSKALLDCESNLRLSSDFPETSQDPPEKLKISSDCWDNIEVLQDEASDSDSGGSDSCPSERETSVIRCRSSIKPQSNVTRKSTTNPKIVRSETDFPNEPKIPKITKTKICIIPKLTVPKMSANLPIVSPTVNAGLKTDRFTVPPIYSQRLVDTKSAPGEKQSSFSVIKRTTVKDLLKNEIQSFSEVRPYKQVITPRNYKLLNISWFGSNPKNLARRIANEVKYKNLNNVNSYK